MQCRIRVLAVLGLLSAAGLSLAQNLSDQNPMSAAERQDRAERLRLADELMDEREASIGRRFDTGWKMSQVRVLAERSQDELQAMLDNLRAGIATDVSKGVGIVSAGLVFTPLDRPCRFYDSRNDALPGQFSAGDQFNFIVAGPIPGGATGQGASSNCDVPLGPALAIVANVLAVDTGGKGNWQVWPFGGTAGDAVINFAANADLDINLINGVMIPICDSTVSPCDFDLTAKLNFAASSDFVINVTGYFSAPEGTALECQTISDTMSVAPDASWNFTSGDCPDGYAMTGGGHNYTVNDGDQELYQVGPEGNAFRCRGKNDDQFTENVTCYARCCRVSGN